MCHGKICIRFHPFVQCGRNHKLRESAYKEEKRQDLPIQKSHQGQPTKPTKFETDKAKLRRTIRQALSQAGSFDEFASLLFAGGRNRQGEPGGGFPTSRRTGQSLSQPGSWGTILTRLLSLPCSRRTPTEPPNRPQPYPNTPTPKRDACERKKPQKPPRQTNTLRMVDRETKRAEGKGVGYDRWASLHNLKQMAATHNFLMENGLLDLDKLDAPWRAAGKPFPKQGKVCGALSRP